MSSTPDKQNQDNDQMLPRHVTIIMDGNGRWAEQHGKPRIEGHRAGVNVTREIIETCAKKGIEVLSLFTFSSENWRRPQKEVDMLMELFVVSLRNETRKLHKNDIQFRLIGDRSRFPEKLLKQIKQTEHLTRENLRMQLVIAANYGGRWDIVQAASKIGESIESGNLSASDITPELFDSFLSISDLPEPDLFIRTGGEKRISNYMLWQLAYTELYFTETLWPDFNNEAFEVALESFGQRQRRFGATGKQVGQTRGA